MKERSGTPPVTNIMGKKYICTANGYGKESKKPYSRFNAIVEGQGYAYIKNTDSYTVPEIVPLLTIKSLVEEEE